MARDDSDDRNRRKDRREEEDRKDEELRQALQKTSGKAISSPGPAAVPQAAQSVEALDGLLARAEPMIEQINNLYQQYLAGVERLPPIDKRKQLEVIMESVLKSAKATPSTRFRAETVYSKFKTMKDLWDKLMADLESGRRKRLNPGRK